VLGEDFCVGAEDFCVGVKISVFGWRVFFFTSTSPLIIYEIGSFETSVTFSPTTRRHIPEDPKSKSNVQLVQRSAFTGSSCPDVASRPLNPTCSCKALFWVALNISIQSLNQWMQKAQHQPVAPSHPHCKGWIFSLACWDASQFHFLTFRAAAAPATLHNFTPIVKDKNLVPAWANNGVDPSEHSGYYMYHLQYH